MTSKYEDAVTIIDQSGNDWREFKAILSTPKNGMDSWVGTAKTPWRAVRRAYKARRQCREHQCKVHGQAL